MTFKASKRTFSKWPPRNPKRTIYHVFDQLDKQSKCLNPCNLIQGVQLHILDSYPYVGHLGFSRWPPQMAKFAIFSVSNHKMCYN